MNSKNKPSTQRARPPATLSRQVRRRASARLRRGPVHLFDYWDEIKSKLRAASSVALFLDLDGTLAPLRKDPNEVTLDASTRQLLRRLTQHRCVTVVFISGRRRPDLLQRIRVPGAVYLGLHGLDRSGQALDPPTALLRAKRLLAARLKDVAGIRIEDKNLCFTVHYRGALSRNVRQARSVLGVVLAPFGSAIQVLKGKKVWEILPAEARGKGAAAQEVLAKMAGNVLPVYVGDDTTDESAFAALIRGVTVRVGRSEATRARYRLRNPAEVKQFLSKLEAEIQ